MKNLILVLTAIASTLTASNVFGQSTSCSPKQPTQALKLPIESPPKLAATSFTATWSAAITSVTIDDVQGQTLRELINSSIGGTSARIKLSNLYGTVPFTMSDIHLAQSAGFNQLATIAGTDHKLTFSSASSITLQPGCEAVSDPVTMTISPLTEYAVSMFFTKAPSAGGFTSGLSDPTDGTNVNDTFVFAGDVSSETNPSSNLVSPFSSYWFLTNFDVQNTAAAGSVVAIGASITQGRHTTGEKPNRWSDLLAQRLNQADIKVGVANMGIAGNNMLTNQLANNSGDSLLDRFSHDVLQQANVKWVILSDDPLNDLASNTVTPQLGTQLINAYQTLISQAHAKNIKVICSTLTPDGVFQATSNGTDEEPLREQIDAFLVGSTSGCDAIFDQAAAVQDPSDIINLLPTFNIFPEGSSDGLHPNDAGHLAIANAFNLGIFTANGVPPVTTPTTPGELLPGQGLLPGKSLLSQDGRFTLTLAATGSLTLREGTTILWAEPNTATPPSELIFQGDGNLVEYDTTGKILWQSGSTGKQGATFLEQNDGNLVIYNLTGMPIFASNTCCH